MKLKRLEKLRGEIDTSEWLCGRRAANCMLMRHHACVTIRSVCACVFHTGRVVFHATYVRMYMYEG